MKRKTADRGRINFLTGMLYQVINTTLGVVLPYLFITNFGSETNGLLSSISQLFVYLGLLEAGVGGATLQALYGPVAKDDKASISAVLAATNSYYIKTGAIYGALLLVLGLLYPFLIKSELSYQTVVSVILLQGAGSAWSFFFQAKYKLLLRAEGKAYIENILALFSSVLRNAGKIVAIYLGYGIVLVQTIHFAIIVLESLITAVYMKRKYSWLDLATKPNYQAISQKDAVMVHSITFLVFNHTDILLLTVITRNLALVSVYSVYSMVFEALGNLISIVSNSFQYKLGRYGQAGPSALLGYYTKYEKFYYFVGFSLNTAGYLLIAPFVKLYTGHATDANYLMRYLPELFFAMKTLDMIRSMSKQPITVVGHFSNTKHISIGEAVSNLAVSIILIYQLGIYGVLIGTIVALLYGVISFMTYTNTRIFICPKWRGWLGIAVYAAATVLVVSVWKKNIFVVETYFGFVKLAIPTTIICAVVVAAASVASYQVDQKLLNLR